MKKLIISIIILLFIIPYQTSADEPSDEEKRISAIQNAVKATVKINVTLTANGSGFFVAKNHIITNSHVVLVPGMKDISITRSDGQKCLGKLDYHDQVLDLALVKVDCEGEPLSLGKDVRVGQDIYVIGSAVVDFAVTGGIISKQKDMDRFIVANVYANSGNSGGAMIDSEGKVIGVVKAKRIEAPYFIYGIQLDDIKAFMKRSGI